MATNNAANFGTGTAGQVLTSNGSGVSPTFQSAPTGGVSSYPAFIIPQSGAYRSFIACQTVAAGSFGANIVYLVPFCTSAAFTLNTMAIYCSTHTTNDTIRMGIYTMTPSTGAGTLLTDFGTVSATAVGFVAKTSLSQAVAAGCYYLAVNFASLNSSYYVPLTVLTTIRHNNNSPANGVYYNIGNNTLPATITQANLNGGFLFTPPVVYGIGTS